MVATTRSFSLFAALALLRLSAANSCNKTRTWTNGYNATGSTSVPGPRPNESYPETTWTWSRYVEDVIDYSSNDSVTWQTIGLKTTPLLNLSDPSTPYTGCAIVILDLNVKSTRTDNGTCSSIFSADCLAEIRNTINSTASSYSGTPAGSANDFNCDQLMTSLTSSTSSSCAANLFPDYAAAQFLPNNFTGYPNPICPLENPGDSNSTDGHRTFFAFSSSIEDQAIDNFTIYDQVVTSHLPIFVAMWLKSTSNSSATGSSLESGGWADTQIMCIPANETQPGSRNFTEAQKTQAGAGGKANGVGIGMLGVVFLTLLFGLV